MESPVKAFHGMTRMICGGTTVESTPINNFSEDQASG